MRITTIGIVLIGVVLVAVGFSTELFVAYEKVRLTSSHSDSYTFPPLFSKSIMFNISEAESILRVGLLADSPMMVYVQLDEKVEYEWEGSELKQNVILPKSGAWVVRIFNNSTTRSSSCTYVITVKEFHYEPTKPLVWLRTPLLICGGVLMSISVPVHFYREVKYFFVKYKKAIGIFIAAATIIVLIFSYQIVGYILHTSTPWTVAMGASMRPTIFAGDMVIIRGTAPENLDIDDIILFDKITDTWGEENFRTMETPVLHRIVVAIPVGDHWYYMTKGDNSSIDDWYVPDEGVIGKAIFVIPRMGLVLAWLGTIQAKIFLIALIILISFVWPSMKPKKKQSDSPGQKSESQVSNINRLGV